MNFPSRVRQLFPAVNDVFVSTEDPHVAVVATCEGYVVTVVQNRAGVISAEYLDESRYWVELDLSDKEQLFHLGLTY